MFKDIDTGIFACYKVRYSRQEWLREGGFILPVIGSTRSGFIQRSKNIDKRFL